MQVMAAEREKMRAARLADLAGKDGQGRLRTAPKGFMQEIVNKLNLRSVFETEEVRDKLKMAGLRGQAPLVAYMFFRVAMPIIIACRRAPLPVRDRRLRLSRAGQGRPCRRRRLYRLLCAEHVHPEPRAAPADLDQERLPGRARHAADLRPVGHVDRGRIPEGFRARSARQSLELAEELSLTTAELSYLQDRRQAFENLGKRTGIPGIKAVATALIQAERYGTPVGQALRVMAKENRDMRMAEAEKKAAALPPKLTVPMIIFFLPVLFVVILGPAIIQVFGYH